MTVFEEDDLREKMRGHLDDTLLLARCLQVLGVVVILNGLYEHNGKQISEWLGFDAFKYGLIAAAAFSFLFACIFYSYRTLRAKLHEQ